MRMCRRHFLTRRHANHARRAVVRVDGVLRYKPAHPAARQPQLFAIVLMDRRHRHDELLLFMALVNAPAMREGVSPKASISSSYVPECMNWGRPSRSSVLIASTRGV